MLLIILSLIDIAVGISLIYPNFLAFYLGIIVLLKGISSVVGSILAKDFIIFLGLIDLIAGLMLIFNFSISWFWVLPMLKGIYCLVVGLGSS